MRTTVDLPDHLLVEAKKLATERRQPVARLFEESLREYLAAQRSLQAEPLPPLPVLDDFRPVAGVDFDDTSALWEVGTDERRRHLERYATWTPADHAEFEEGLRAQRTIDDELWR